MKNITKTIGTITAMIIILVCAYLLGTTQKETITEIQTITEEKEVIPEEYIDTASETFKENYIDMRMVIDYNATEDGLQLYFVDGTGYYLER